MVAKAAMEAAQNAQLAASKRQRACAQRSRGRGCGVLANKFADVKWNAGTPHVYMTSIFRSRIRSAGTEAERHDSADMADAERQMSQFNPAAITSRRPEAADEDDGRSIGITARAGSIQ